MSPNQASEAQNLYFDSSILLPFWQGNSQNSPKFSFIFLARCAQEVKKFFQNIPKFSGRQFAHKNYTQNIAI